MTYTVSSGTLNSTIPYHTKAHLKHHTISRRFPKQAWVFDAEVTCPDLWCIHYGVYSPNRRHFFLKTRSYHCNLFLCETFNIPTTTLILHSIVLFIPQFHTTHPEIRVNTTQIQRQTDRQTGRQADRQTDRQTGRVTVWLTDTQTRPIT